MRAGDLADDAVRAQERQQPGDAAGLPAALGGVLGSPAQGGAQVPVAEAGHGPLTLGDDFQHRRIGGGPRIERPVTPAFFGGPLADGGGESSGGQLHFGRRERIEVAIIDRRADLSAAGRVGDTLAQHHPTRFRVGLALGGTEDAKRLWIVHGRLDAHDVPKLVVELHTVALDIVLEPHALGGGV